MRRIAYGLCLLFVGACASLEGLEQGVDAADGGEDGGGGPTDDGTVHIDAAHLAPEDAGPDEPGSSPDAALDVEAGNGDAESVVLEAGPVEAGDAMIPGDAGCSATSVSWTQAQPSWAGNAKTAGMYSCSGSVSAAAHGATVSASLAPGKHVGAAQYKCNDGTWSRVTGSCDGEIVPTTHATGLAMECSGTGTRGLWISWYLADLARCGDTGSLDYWVNEYDNDMALCQPGNGYDGWGNKDACWRAQFRAGAGACYTETKSTGHICASVESQACGTDVYPWGTSNAMANGMKCKYPPP